MRFTAANLIFDVLELINTALVQKAKMRAAQAGECIKALGLW